MVLDGCYCYRIGCFGDIKIFYGRENLKLSTMSHSVQSLLTAPHSIVGSGSNHQRQSVMEETVLSPIEVCDGSSVKNVVQEESKVLYEKIRLTNRTDLNFMFLRIKQHQKRFVDRFVQNLSDLDEKCLAKNTEIKDELEDLKLRVVSDYKIYSRVLSILEERVDNLAQQYDDFQLRLVALENHTPRHQSSNEEGESDNSPELPKSRNTQEELVIKFQKLLGEPLPQFNLDLLHMSEKRTTTIIKEPGIQGIWTSYRTWRQVLTEKGEFSWKNQSHLFKTKDAFKYFNSICGHLHLLIQGGKDIPGIGNAILFLNLSANELNRINELSIKEVLHWWNSQKSSVSPYHQCILDMAVKSWFEHDISSWKTAIQILESIKIEPQSETRKRVLQYEASETSAEIIDSSKRPKISLPSDLVGSEICTL